MNEQLYQSIQIKNQANEFLAQTRLIELLSQYGQVIINGSYALDLMVWNDIDLNLILPPHLNPVNVHIQIARELLDSPLVHAVKLINFTKAKNRTDLPEGVYSCITYRIPNEPTADPITDLDKQSKKAFIIPEDNINAIHTSLYPTPNSPSTLKARSIASTTEWKVDLWTLSENDQAATLKFFNLIKSNLNEELKLLILKLKFLLKGNSKRVPQHGSYLIYKAIFEFNLTEEKNIISFLKTQGYFIN
ncbi:hypothetical protein [Rickettsiales endosymbiont of Stachyamoeba lipophora]|uniref:hypothetical protein n=1 Tax=Rickettsiales endosymbiont of Stachyamoeba lipophora TaxID=2486578 RepID=UPI000F65144E|nr:hypothetical protein [Rickettsiales endosymbiont of Stachyamoeba lipophora]AZL15938.1 hypothetical protein EF513_05215 [Rickettsiales endosymbiont of Stachyamoeba lipophora]